MSTAEAVSTAAEIDTEPTPVPNGGAVDVPNATGPANTLWLAASTLAVREVVRFFRQRSRLIGAFLQPVIFWVLFGAGLRGSFAPPEWAPEAMSYQEFFLPGVAVMIVLFTAIFATISIIEDRNEGFLQGVLVAPVPRLAIVLGKVGGGAAIAVIQAVVFLLIGPLLGLVGLGPAMTIAVTPGIAVSTLGVVALLAVTLTALGYCLAWPSRSTQGFHALMSVFLFPMWLLSGAFFPGEEGWIRWVVSANPLTYGVAALRRSLYPAETFADAGRLPGMGLSIVVTLLFGAVCVGIATWLTTRREAKNAR